MRQTRLDETSDYARLLDIFAAFDPQIVDTTPWQEERKTGGS